MGIKPRHTEQEQLEYETLWDELLEDLENCDRLEEAISMAMGLEELVPRTMKDLRKRLGKLIGDTAEQLRCIDMGEPAPTVEQPQPYNKIVSAESEKQAESWSGTYSQTVAVPQAMVDQEVLCQGLLVCFFTSKNFATNKRAIEVLDLWLELVPEGTTNWALVGGNATEKKQFNKRSYGRCRAQLSKPNGFFSVGGPQKKNPLFAFEISSSDWSPSTLELRFPMDFPPQKIQAFIEQAVPLLGCFTAFASPSLFISNHGRDSEQSYAETHYLRLAARHPGLTIFGDVLDMEGQTRGAHWLTFLSPKHLSALGGAKALRDKLPMSHFSKVGKGLLLRTGEATDVGDLLSGETLPDLRALAGVLEAHTRFSSHISLWNHESGELLQSHWMRRFLAEPTELSRLARQLAHLTVVENLAQELVDAPATRSGAKRLSDLIESEPYLLKLLAFPISDRLRELVPTFVLQLFCAGELDNSKGNHLLDLYGPGRVLSSFRESALCESGRHLEVLDYFLARFRNRSSSEEQKKAFAEHVRSFGETLIPHHPTRLTTILDVVSNYKEIFAHFLNNVTMHLYSLCDHDLDAAEILADEVVAHCYRYPDMLLTMACIYAGKDRIDDALTQVELAAEHGFEEMHRFQSYDELKALWPQARFKAVFA